MKTIQIKTNHHSYPVLIGSNITEQLPYYLEKSGITKKTKILIITDHHIAPLYLDVIKHVLSHFSVLTYIISAGEHSKSLQEAEKIIQYAIENGLDRSSLILALGGGVVGDLAGFVSAVYMRGIRFIQCPTTILAHDSSVGGKVGINHPMGKNLIGAFHQPELVFYDTAFLKSLPIREIRSGLAEVIKEGLIRDESFTEWLYDHAESLLQVNLQDMNEALLKGISVKAEIVQEDEKETGIRAVLNYGHTLAHPIETISNYQYLHGEAVAIGMVFASHLAYKLGMISEQTAVYTRDLISRFDLPTSIPSQYSDKELIHIMMHDKKFKQNTTRFILPVNIGEVIIKDGIGFEILSEAIDELKN